MTTTTHIKFGDGLAVTDEGGGTIRVDGQGGPAGATGPAGPAGPAGPPGTTPDISGKVDRDAVEAATNRLVQVKLAAGDTQPAFKIQGDGKLLWGPGGTTAPDTTMNREAAGYLRTNAGFLADNVIYASYAEASTQQVVVGAVGPGGTAGVFLGDVAFYRYAFGNLASNGLFSCQFVSLGTVKTLDVGGIDSGGAGYRMVRVPN